MNNKHINREILVVNVFYLVLHNNSNTDNKNCIQNSENISCNFIKINANPNIKIYKPKPFNNILRIDLFCKM